MRKTVLEGREYLINSGHGYLRTHKSGNVAELTGKTMDEVDSTIIKHLDDHIASGGTLPKAGKGHYEGVVEIGGESVGYRAIQRPDGRPHIGTYYPN